MAKDWRHTWQYWGEERRQRSLKKSFDKWESEFEDMEENEHESVFLVMNEWVANDENDVSEIVALFHTEDAAWDELSAIAREHDVILGVDDTSFAVPTTSGYSPDETYYIEERQYND